MSDLTLASLASHVTLASHGNARASVQSALRSVMAVKHLR